MTSKETEQEQKDRETAQEYKRYCTEALAPGIIERINEMYKKSEAFKDEQKKPGLDETESVIDALARSSVLSKEDPRLREILREWFFESDAFEAFTEAFPGVKLTPENQDFYMGLVIFLKRLYPYAFTAARDYKNRDITPEEFLNGGIGGGEAGPARKTVYKVWRASFLIRTRRKAAIQRFHELLENEIKKPEYEGLTIEELEIKADKPGTDEQPNKYAQLWQQAQNNAREAMQREEAEAEAPAMAAYITSVQHAKDVLFPLDKANLDIWRQPTAPKEKQTLAMEENKPSNKKKPKQIDLIYSIDFSELEAAGLKIAKRLTMFDQRVYIAAASLYNAGNSVISLRQIHYAMGQPKTSNPSKAQLQKIDESITKMRGAILFVDDSQEHNTYNYDIDEHAPDGGGWNGGVYDGSLLPMERRHNVLINGKLTEAAIYLFREPPLITFAKLRGQITTFKMELLQSPISKTVDNLSIDNYLLWRISRAKNPKNKRRQEKILLKTLFVKVGAADTKKKSRTIEKVKKYLEYYEEQNFIYNSQVDENDGSITVFF